LPIEEEMARFDRDCELLDLHIFDLAKGAREQESVSSLFLAESILFRLFRAYERLVRETFLHFCVAGSSVGGNPVISKLRCDSTATAEKILKAGNKYLDWGNPETTRGLADLIFEGGFPVSNLLVPLNSELVDLLRFRNFVAHDSDEAARGFQKSSVQYVRVGDPSPQSVGELALYRRHPRSDITLRLLFAKVSKLTTHLRIL
jgi:hypothetical protein